MIFRHRDGLPAMDAGQGQPGSFQVDDKFPVTMGTFKYDIPFGDFQPFTLDPFRILKRIRSVTWCRVAHRGQIRI